MCHTPRHCIANLLTNVSKLDACLMMREGGRLPGALGLSTGLLPTRVMCRIRTQSFIGVAVSQTSETVDGAF